MVAALQSLFPERDLGAPPTVPRDQDESEPRSGVVENDARTDLRAGLESVNPAVFRVLRRMGVTDEEADDAMQRVLIQLARRWDDLGRLPMNELHAYACAVAAGVAIDVGRERGRRNARLVSLRDGAGVQPDDDRPDDAFEHKRKLEVLDRILESMPEERRVVFILHEIEELAMRQIADRLGLAMGTVASRLRKAREEFERAALRARAAEERNGGNR